MIYGIGIWTARSPEPKTGPWHQGLCPSLALSFLAVLGLIGLLVLIQLPMTAIITGIAALPLIVIYPLAKRFTGLPQIVLGPDL